MHLPARRTAWPERQDHGRWPPDQRGAPDQVHQAHQRQPVHPAEQPDQGGQHVQHRRQGNQGDPERRGVSECAHRARIESGEYPQGARIPTESEMVETWEVARTTARRTVALLREEGLVDTVPQRGTYVR